MERQQSAARAVDEFAEARRQMVDVQLRRRGIVDEHVLQAMAIVPRHEFVPAASRGRAYADEPVPIGLGQTVSQPLIVAVMVSSLQLGASERVLEIGTGCGYQAAVLSLLVKEVHTVERLPELARAAAERLERLGYLNVQVHCADGTLGWPEAAPYDAILVAAAAPAIPQPLLDQLGEGGRVIAPVGSTTEQEMQKVTRHGAEYAVKCGGPCRFVPLLGKHGWQE